MLENKKVLIIGASGGIGQAVAGLCTKLGASVGLHFHKNQGKIEEGISFDVSSLKEVTEGVAAFVKKHGRIDGLINCSGLNIAGPLISLDEDQIRSQLTVNLAGAIHVSHAAVTHMVRQRSGSIVHLGSVSAHRMIRGHSIYSATKAGLEGFSKALAAEVAKRGVRVNCLLPGPVMTPMLQKSIDETGDNPVERVPMGRLVEADEIAQMAAFLISDGTAAVTGSVIPVDGGYLLW